MGGERLSWRPPRRVDARGFLFAAGYGLATVATMMAVGSLVAAAMIARLGRGRGAG